MKATGMIRKVDELGRIVLPIELRRNLDIIEHDELEIFVDTDAIVLRKHEASCVFCDGPVMLQYREKYICADCLKKLCAQNVEAEEE